MWRDYEIHHRDPNSSRVVLEAVRPLAVEVGPAVDRLYFVRHWLHGSHIRICIDAPAEIHRQVARPALDRIVRPWLEANPFRSVADESSLVATHRRLAELEHERGQVLPIEPDGVIREREHDDRRHILGSIQAVRLLSDFYSGTNEFAFELIERTPDARRRLHLAFEMMIATAHQSSGIGIRRGFVSFRSHAEAFLSWWPEADGLRASWDEHFATHADSLINQMEDVLARIDTEGSTPPTGVDGDPVQRWPRLLHPVLDRGAYLLRTGAMSMDPPWAGRTSLEDEYVASLAARSPWHNRPRPSAEPVDQLWFGRYKLALNYTYLQLTRIGLTPVERFLLCHLIANAVETRWGLDAAEVILPSSAELAEVRQ